MDSYGDDLDEDGSNKEPYFERFKKNLMELYNLTWEEVAENYKWYGGSGYRDEDGETLIKETSHLRYYKVVCGHMKIPPIRLKCLCKHKIKENCYLSDQRVEHDKLELWNKIII